MSVSLARAVPHLVAHGSGATAALLRLAARFRPGAIDAGVRRLHDPVMARTISAMIHDTVSVGIIRAGVKYNVIPGTAYIEIDCRTLPGTDEPAMHRELRRRIGEKLWARLEIECEQVGSSVSAPLDGPLYPLLEQVLRDHDAAAVPLPFLAPFATDAKHLARIGIPTYGFSPLKTGRDDGLLALMHGDDERVGVEALRFGLPVLWDAVRRFCA
jgi:acetylornithine deacetylase/succinyl-diaminopimelate desuccinylase-like protein